MHINILDITIYFNFPKHLHAAKRENPVEWMKMFIYSKARKMALNTHKKRSKQPRTPNQKIKLNWKPVGLVKSLIKEKRNGNRQIHYCKINGIVCTLRNSIGSLYTVLICLWFFLQYRQEKTKPKNLLHLEIHGYWNGSQNNEKVICLNWYFIWLSSKLRATRRTTRVKESWRRAPARHRSRAGLKWTAKRRTQSNNNNKTDKNGENGIPGICSILFNQHLYSFPFDRHWNRDKLIAQTISEYNRIEHIKTTIIIIDYSA